MGTPPLIQRSNTLYPLLRWPGIALLRTSWTLFLESNPVGNAGTVGTYPSVLAGWPILNFALSAKFRVGMYRMRKA